MLRKLMLPGLAAGLLSLSLAAPALSPVVKNTPSLQLHTLLNEHWAWQTRESPESATMRGDHRYNDQLRDMSVAAAQARKAQMKRFHERLKAIDAKELQGQERISYDIMMYGWGRQIEQGAMFGDLPFAGGFGDGWLPISPMHGPNRTWGMLLRTTPFRNVTDYENFLQRLNALPTQLQQTEAWLSLGLKSGWVAPRAAMLRVPDMLNQFISADVDKHPMFAPFTRFPANIREEDRKRLAEQGRAAVGEKVNPAFLRLQKYLRDTYLPGARTELAAGKLPGGARYYDMLVADSTTTRMTAKEVHELGLAEVKRISAEMDKTIAKIGFKGDRVAFNQHLNTADFNFFKTAAEMLGYYRDLAKRADALMPQYFTELPRLPYGIRPMDASEGANPERYNSGAADGSRAGYFEANTNDPRTRPKHWMAAVLLHEAVPGHHLQNARQQELKGLPNQRLYGGYSAFGEGWGLYSEYLGEEMGFYDDLYSYYGRLSAEMHRAARLVVDTGLHAYGWTREQTIQYLVDYAGITRAFAEAETDRYIVWPGQALSYKIGELRIKALRRKAEAALGEKFDLRKFHNAVLDNGSLPLDVLDQLIEEWIAGQKKFYGLK
ncbi:MAG: DUF885 domain-containing protein [Betaproteobacteria bacterium]|nr:DUF885 domain-containing protein [Betaproteobacteria bacterium]